MQKTFIQSTASQNKLEEHGHYTEYPCAFVQKKLVAAKLDERKNIMNYSSPVLFVH